MDLLFSSDFLLLIVFLVTQFLDSKNSKILILWASAAIFIGFCAIVYVSTVASSVKIQNPIEITVQNSSNQNLKIYAITFDKDINDTINRKVFFDKELSVAYKSTFSIENNQLGKFWIVAKNETNQIKYLKSFDQISSNIVVEITQNATIEEDGAQTARELIFDRDIKQQVLNFAIWSNVLLIVLLFWSIFKLTKIKNRTNLKTD